MNNRLLWIIILIAGVGLIISANIFRDTNPGPITDNPGNTNEPTNTPEIQITPTSTARPQAFLPPATCQISGSIRFIEENLYETLSAKIAYQNVDDVIRQIYWKSSPDDGILLIGPNLFENLVIPNGEREIGVTLKGQPAVQNYILTASITYGVKNLNGDIESKIANCSGVINVDVSNI